MRVVIVGGGFAAVQFAKTLRKRLKASACEILLFNRENHMVFHPLLADVAGASINGDAAATPLRQMLPGVSCRTERVQQIDLAASEIAFDNGNGVLNRLQFDHVVIACGAESNLGIIPGMTEYAFAFKVMRDAIDLRQHVVRQMELAEATGDPEHRRRHLSFIVVGAGFSGVEVAGELNELVRSSTRFYRCFKKEDVTVTMVHPHDVILPELSRTLGEFAQKKMEKAGVTILLNTRAVAATHEGVQLSNGQLLEGRTVVCTIGTAVSPLVAALDVPKEHGRIRTTSDMRIEGHGNAWALGDCALIINAFDGKPSAPTGQFAERQGRQAAENLARVVKGEATRPFHFKALGQLCSIGGYEAVAEMFGMRISGFMAWILWRGVYLFKLPTWSRRFKVGLDWAWDILFPRDLSFLNTDTAQDLTHAYFRAGDMIHRQGEPARTFSVIEEGDAEVLEHTDDGGESRVVLSVLAKGDFFGGKELIGSGPYVNSIRARSAVRLRQLGSALFSNVVNTFTPFRELLAKEALRRSSEFWSRVPLAKQILETEPLPSLMEPLPSPVLRKNTPLAEAMGALNDSATGELVIVDEAGKLWGTFGRGDVHIIIAGISAIPEEKRTNLQRRELSEFVVASPLCVALDDSTLLAAMTMMEHEAAWLPVVQSKSDLRPVGYLRGERMATRMMERVAKTEEGQARAAG